MCVERRCCRLKIEKLCNIFQKLKKKKPFEFLLQKMLSLGNSRDYSYVVRHCPILAHSVQERKVEIFP